MKNFKHIFKTQLALAFVLLSANFGFAQTVTVPSNCTVVLPGTGGTVGAGGKVGYGGLVSMPDQQAIAPYAPNQGGSFTFNQPSGVTTASWLLKGDLTHKVFSSSVNIIIPPSTTSITVTGNFNAAVQTTTGLIVDIFSYNKAFRPSEYLAPSNKDWARSNGRVTVSWDEGLCGKSMYFDVCKRFTNSTGSTVPAIVGPNCLKPNTVYTYSVDKIVSDNANDAIGFDSYYWSGIPAAYYQNNNPDFYTSADGSSITFKTGATVSPITLQCCYGRVNPTTINVDGGPSFFLNTPVGTHTTCVTKSIVAAPLQPVFSAVSANLTSLSTMNLAVNPSACLPTGAANFTLTYPNSGPGQSYVWTSSNPNWTFSNNTTATTTTTVTPQAGDNSPQTITLTITGNSCDPAVFTYKINRSLAAPLVIAPTVALNTCLNSTSSGNTYTVPNSTGNTITWTINNPSGLTGITLGNANTPTVTVNTAGTAAGTFDLVATSSFCSGSITLPITVKPSLPVFTTTSPTCMLKGATGITTIQVDTTAPGTPTTGYVWDLTGAPGWSNVGTVAQQTSSTPTFTAGTGAGPVIIKVSNGVSPCNSAQASRTITYSTILTAPNSSTSFCDQYAVTCGTVNSWIINGTTYTVSGTNFTISGNNLSICGNSGAVTSVSANVTVNGTTAVLVAPSLGTHGLRQASPSTQGTKIDNAIIYPNPNDGNFTIKIIDFRENATAIVTDMTGKKVGNYNLVKGENNIKTTNLPKGSYIVILQIDGKTENKQLIVE
ncbi:T9SS type A sorting domain-containing protein [Flavobacterium sp.]|uniref:T9SS type A sorting domain-containing protein n=1 Tax=Flavobacterium sp. TaxID=239 RepID=UPI002639317D|nr:T9SS type A sorting domain-containing protein [Flavobacterium sp.]